MINKYLKSGDIYLLIAGDCPIYAIEPFITYTTKIKRRWWPSFSSEIVEVPSGSLLRIGAQSYTSALSPRNVIQDLSEHIDIEIISI